MSFQILLFLTISSPGSLRAGSSDTCVGIAAPNSVTYSVRVTASPEACQDPDQLVSARIQFVGFGEVDLSIRLICDCGCEAASVSRVTLSWGSCESHVTCRRRGVRSAMEREFWSAPPASAQSSCELAFFSRGNDDVITLSSELGHSVLVPSVLEH